MFASVRALALILALTSPKPAVGADTIAAEPAPDPLRLDGRLDESAWMNARVVARLTQQSPNPGKPTDFETTVRILVTGDTLYLGYECFDPEPDKISIHTMQRDGFVRGDDTVTVVLDTHGDRRTGYYFQVNAAGARIDGLISDPEEPSLDWDGIWDVRTARLEHGWSAEIEIPSRSLNFSSGVKAWGLNLERFVARERITLRWTSPTLDSFITDLSRAGSLTGIEDLRQGRGLDFAPYGIGRMKSEFAGDPRVRQGTAGFDVTWRITPELASVFTFNTDFAETEVDTRQINLTRFPLFFPEKRAFFLEGANQFEFALAGESFIPFFSRRIGLLEGQQIPINGGVKVNGRVGRWNLAMLDVQTRETGGIPGTNLFAGRASFDVTPRFRIGTLVTNGDPSGRSSNTLTGFDAVWRTSEFRGNKNFQVGAYTAFSSGDLPDGGRGAWGFKVDYPNDLLDCFVKLDMFGEAIDPALGFLPRPGTRQYQGGCSFKPRPADNGPLDWIRQAFFRNYYTRVDGVDGVNESWLYTFTPASVQLESGEELSFGFEPQYEYLREPFEISEGVVIPAGSYRFGRWVMEMETSEHRSWQIEMEASTGTFYSGRLTSVKNQFSWTSAGGRVQAGLDVENNFGRLREGHFVQRLYQPQFAFAWNPQIVFTSFIQYDTESHNLGTNTRLRWTFKPGQDLFVVWNRGWQRLPTPGRLSLDPESEILAVKLRWTFRM
jgi:hypothetical protein